MNKLILILILALSSINANDIHQQYKNMHPKTKTFKSPKEFKTKKTVQKRIVHQTTNRLHPSVTKNVKYYHNNRNHNYYDDGYRTSNNYQHHTYNYYPKAQRGYRHPKRSWFYAYRYTKADFVDRYGFYYGYFDRRGYMFEGEFYRYDRDYRYQDRLRGRGLFDRHLYYAPLPRIYRDDLYR